MNANDVLKWEKHMFGLWVANNICDHVPIFVMDREEPNSQWEKDIHDPKTGIWVAPSAKSHQHMFLQDWISRPIAHNRPIIYKKKWLAENPQNHQKSFTNITPSTWNISWNIAHLSHRHHVHISIWSSLKTLWVVEPKVTKKNTIFFHQHFKK